MMPLRDLRQDQDGNYIALNVEQKRKSRRPFQSYVTKTKQLQTGEYPKATQQSTALRLLGERTLMSDCRIADHRVILAA
jgi:hypothetical protein